MAWCQTCTKPLSNQWWPSFSNEYMYHYAKRKYYLNTNCFWEKHCLYTMWYITLYGKYNVGLYCTFVGSLAQSNLTHDYGVVAYWSHMASWIWVNIALAPSHYLNKWFIISWTPLSKFKWNFNQFSNIFIQGNLRRNVVHFVQASLPCTHRLLHSPNLEARGLSVGYETRPPIGCLHSFVIGWSKYRLGLPYCPIAL